MGQIFTGSPWNRNQVIYVKEAISAPGELGGRKGEAEGPVVCAVICKSGIDWLHKHFIIPDYFKRKGFGVYKDVQANNLPSFLSFFLATPRGLWELSSLTRDWTLATAVKAQNLRLPLDYQETLKWIIFVTVTPPLIISTKGTVTNVCKDMYKKKKKIYKGIHWSFMIVKVSKRKRCISWIVKGEYGLTRPFGQRIEREEGFPVRGNSKYRSIEMWKV